MMILFTLFTLLVGSYASTQDDIDYIGESLGVSHVVVRNYPDWLISLTLQNNGLKTIADEDWEIHFCGIRLIVPIQSEVDASKLNFTHIDGCAFKLQPIPGFSLLPGQQVTIKYKENAWAVSRTDFMPNWYVVSASTNARIIQSTEGEGLEYVGPLDSAEKWKRLEIDRYDPYTAEDRYKLNEGAASEAQPIIPTPKTYTVRSNRQVQVNSSWSVKAPAQYNYPSQLLRAALNIPSAANPADKYIEIRAAGSPLGEEGYRLTVDPTAYTVLIEVGGYGGALYGVQSLLAVLYNSDSLQELYIEDEPRYSHRGMHLDVSRNFRSVADILKIISQMSRYKQNKLHLHFTDDEGWRLEIPGLPELTAVGAHRCHDPTETKCLMPQLGSGPSNTGLGSGFYTVAQYQQILKAAQDNNIDVIPEVDIPGHSHAAIRAMETRYKALLPDQQAAEQYRLIDPADQSEYLSIQMFKHNTINPCINGTYNFLTKVIEELKKMHQNFQPLKQFHFGGDEISHDAWRNTTSCDVIAGGTSGSDRHYRLLEYLVQQVSKITVGLNLNLAAWGDGLVKAHGEPFNRTELKNTEVTAYTWHTVWEWGGFTKIYKLANAGYKVVLSLATHTYFDHPYEPDPTERGYYWAARIAPTKKTFGLVPGNIYNNMDVDRMGAPTDREAICRDIGCPKLNEQMKHNIIGVQGQVFSETIRTSEQFEYMVFPRMLALAERSWHHASWEETTDRAERDRKAASDWRAFAAALGSRESRRMEDERISYRLPPPGAKWSDSLQVNSEMPGLSIECSSNVGFSWTSCDLINQNTTDPVLLRTRSHDGRRVSRTVYIQQKVAPENRVTSSASLLTSAVFLITVLHLL